MLTKRGGWPYSNPINVPFTINLNSPQAKGLVAWWPLGAGQYGMVRDVMGRWHMTATNGPTLVNDGRWGPVTLFDDGLSQYQVHTGTPVTTEPLTIAGWFNANDNGAGMAGTIGAIGYSGTARYVRLLASGANDQVSATVGGDGGTKSATTTTLWLINQWHHACAVFYSTSSRAAFLDGGGKGTNSDVSAMSAGADRASVGVTIVDGAPTWYMSGMIRDVRIYNRALSDAEIQAIYHNPWELFAPLIPVVFGKAPTAPGPTLSIALDSTDLTKWTRGIKVVA